MENASKALIIAGSILVAILLISVAVLIMNSTGDTQRTVEDTAKSTATRSFNSQFIPYEGSGISAAQVRSLISAVNASKSSGHTINVYNSATGTTAFSATSLVSTRTYTVAFEYGTDGYLSIIRIY